MLLYGGVPSPTPTGNSRARSAWLVFDVRSVWTRPADLQGKPVVYEDLNLHDWRRDDWKPALRAAGLEYRTPMRCGSRLLLSAIAAGVHSFELARMMATSVL